jgi:hypothetical protein
MRDAFPRSVVEALRHRQNFRRVGTQRLGCEHTFCSQVPTGELLGTHKWNPKTVPTVLEIYLEVSGVRRNIDGATTLRFGLSSKSPELSRMSRATGSLSFSDRPLSYLSEVSAMLANHSLAT